MHKLIICHNIKPRITLCAAIMAIIVGYGTLAVYGQDDPPIKIDTVLINIPLIVSDRTGKAIEGLQAEDFRVLSGGREQTIAFFSDSEVNLNVAIVVDVTGSVGSVFSGIKKAARDFVDKLGPDDQGMLVTFGEEIKVLQQLTHDKEKLKKRISAAERIPNGSALMNASLLSVLRGEFMKVPGRKAIIVITDAGEINSFTTSMLMGELIEGDAIVFPIYFPTATSWYPRGKQQTLAGLIRTTPVGRLNDIANATGGRLLVAADNDFRPQFQKITDQLKIMYVVGFYPDINGDKPNDVGITVKREGAVVRSKAIIRAKSIKGTPRGSLLQ